MPQDITVGSFLFDFLYKQGADCVFGIPGDFALPTFRWLQESPMDLVTLTHEPSVGFAADGYARVNGLGVALVTYCVGGLNMLNSVACAYAEKSPMIVISGGPSPSDKQADPLLHHKVRTFDSQRRIYEEVTCATAVLDSPETAADDIMRVVSEVQRQCRPGYIEVPFDVVDMPISTPIIHNTPPPASDKDNLNAAIEDAVDCINHAKNPVIIADVELHRHGLTDFAVGMATRFNIPIASTLLSKSVISEQNPLYIGVYSGGFSEPHCQEMVEESDCVIMLGAFITDMFLGLNTAQLERKDTILATTEKTRISLRSYTHIQLHDFLEALSTSNITKRPDFINPVTPLAPLILTEEERQAPIAVEGFFRLLDKEMPNGATIVCDTGDALLGAIGLRTSARANFLSDAYYLSMGFAVPAAIGATKANPDSRIITIVGDGAFQMTGIELSTIAKEGMNPIICLINNDGYGTQRHILDGPFNHIHPWDYPKICELLRYGKAYQAKTMGELERALQESIASDEMALIEIIVPRDDCSPSLRRLGEELGKLRNQQKRS